MNVKYSNITDVDNTIFCSAVQEYSDTVAKHSGHSVIVQHVRELRDNVRCVACTEADSRVMHTIFDRLKCQAQQTY
jgi:hypothetical protein